MTTTDRWLLERADKQKQADAQASKLTGSFKATRYAAKFDDGFDGLWKSLQTEIARQVGVYNDAVGRSDALVATMSPTSIGVRASDGRELTISVDRTQRTLIEAFRNSAGATRSQRPRIGLRVDSEGRLAFNFGVVRSAAASILRRVID